MSDNQEKEIIALRERVVTAHAEIASLTASLREKEEALESAVALLDDLVARWHSAAHEQRGEEYNEAAVALCDTERCRRALQVIERLRAALAVDPTTGHV